MNALSHDFPLQPETHRAGSLHDRWHAAHDAGRAVARLAQLAEEDLPPEALGFASRADGLDAARRSLVSEAIDDLAALLQVGLRSLSALSEQGRDPTAPALQVWREYYRARSAIMALAGP